MILGLGSDLCDARRLDRALARFGPRFAERIFSDGERGLAEARRSRAETYARRWAAKEACAKALGTGFAEGVGWRDIEVVRAPSGAPDLRLTGGAAERLRRLTPPGRTPFIHLTMTDEPPYAQAVVVIEAREEVAAAADRDGGSSMRQTTGGAA